jgi:hypothetical protein
MMHSHAQPFVLALACLTLASCVAPRYATRYYHTRYLEPYGGFTGRGRATPDNVSYWDGDNATGAPRMLVRLSEQRAYFYKGDRLVGIAVISTGREGYETPSGSFRVIQKEVHHRSSLYGDFVDATGNVVLANVDATKDRPPPGTRFLGSEMPYFMRIRGGYGMHAGFLPGFPASHGCIRMPLFLAQKFFAYAPVGTPVRVTH